VNEEVWHLSRVWVLVGAKAGDNAQILRAAEASGLACEIKQVRLKKGFEGRKPRVRPTIQYVDTEASSNLEPPWPDLVLTIGRDLSLVALWIKQQSQGRTRIALFNAAKGRAADFDLIVLPPYYRARGAANELPIHMPLIGVVPARLATAHEAFAAQLAALPKPLTVLLVGGDMGARKLEPDFAASLLSTLQVGPAAGGSIYVSTSRRTPARVADALEKGLRAEDRIFRWGTPGQENPYFGLLAHGEVFVVTADSLSMIIEVARLGKPVVVAEPPARTGLAGLWERLSGTFRARDLSKAVTLLRQTGHVTRLGEPLRLPAEPLPDDTARVAEALRGLLAAKVE
jgi:uncharacterized protein